MWGRRLFLAASLCVGATGVVAAQTIQESARQCASSNPDTAISGCTAEIQSGQLSDDDLVVAFEYRGKAYLPKQDYDRAIADFTQAIRLKPDDAHAFCDRGAAYDAKGDEDHALADFNEAIRLDPTGEAGSGTKGYAFNDRGVVYLDKGLYDQAIADENQALSFNSAYAYPYLNRGRAYLAKGLYDNAIADESEAISLKLDADNLMYAYVLRGQAYEHKGFSASAIGDYRAALKIDPNFHGAVQLAQDGLKRLGAAP